MSFSKRGSIVSQNSISRMERMLQNHKGGKVTMGVGIPRQAEGGVGDMTVRTLSDGLRCYIKTDSGWYDVNNMNNEKPLEWIPMNLENNWTHNTAGGVPSYAKDPNGFVHFRGALAKGDTTYGDTLTTLPVGYRPFNGHIIQIIAVGTTNYMHVLVRDNSGVVIPTLASHTSFQTISWLDGFSFFAGDTETSVVGTSSNTSGGGGGAGGGGA